MSTKKFFITLCSSLLILSVGFIAFKQRTAHPVHECDNIFAYVYPTFKLQLLSTLKSDTDLDKNHSKLAHALLTPLAELRSYHENWVVALRHHIKEKKAEQGALTQRLSSWLFLESDLGEAMQAFLNGKYPFPPYHAQFGNLIKNYHQEIFNDKTLFNPYKMPPFSDEFGYGNLPSYLFSLSDTRVIRTPNCAKDISPLKAFFLRPEEGVQEEFFEYITHLNHRRHVYVNLMKRHGKEGQKSVQLEQFEHSHPSLILVTLDKDSDFYWQNAQYNEQNDTSEFKVSFLRHLFMKNGPYYWSKKLDESTWEKTWSEIIGHVQETYFDKKNTLSKQERQDFIELCYLEFTHYLINHFQPLSINLSCKQSMDRGPSLTALLFAEELIKQQRLEQQYQKLLTMLFAPPILVHNRHSHTSRIDRFVSAFEHIKQYHENKNNPI